MPEIVGDDPFSLDELAAWVAAGRAWVALDDDGVLVADLVGGDLHVAGDRARAALLAPGLHAACRDQAELTVRSLKIPG